METKLFNQHGEEIGNVKLPKNLFETKINRTLLWETVKIILNNQRQGTAKTKNRAEVKGGGKKPWRQKGIGWARHGSIRSPIWRKGGVVFGPKPRDYYKTIPQKKKTSALLSALGAVAKENRIYVIEDIALDKPRTKQIQEILSKIKLNETKVLIVTNTIDRNLLLASRNIPGILLKRTQDINCYDVISADYLLFTKNGLSELEKRCATNK
ncbi:MAG: 50S ribosomal protein L4 [candidate division WOR-3 bacterium]